MVQEKANIHRLKNGSWAVIQSTKINSDLAEDLNLRANIIKLKL